MLYVTQRVVSQVVTAEFVKSSGAALGEKNVWASLNHAEAQSRIKQV